MIKGFITEYDGREVLFDEYFDIVRKGEDPGSLPLSVLHGIRDMYSDDEEVNGIRVSSLVGCSRRAYFNATVGKGIEYVRPSEVYAMFRGRIAHKVMEEHPEIGGIDELRYEKDWNGIKVTGKPDRIVVPEKKIVDYKTVKKVPEYGKVYSSHEKQLNLYRWLIKDLYEIDKLEVVYMDMETAKTLSARVWSDKEIEDFLEEKVGNLDESIRLGVAPKYKKVWECEYCPFVVDCKKELREEFMKELERRVKAGGKVTSKEVAKVIVNLTN